MAKIKVTKVKAGISFWRHPIQWWMDRKTRKMLDRFVSKRWEDMPHVSQKDLRTVEKILMDFLEHGKH